MTVQRVRAAIIAFRYTPALAGSIAIIGALTNWLWWWLHIPPLTPLTWPSSPSSPLGALCLMLLGGALALRSSSAAPPLQRALGIGLTLVAALLAGLSIAQGVGGRDFGLDTMLFREAVLQARAAGDASHIPGRMGNTSSLTVLLLGAALLAIHGRAWVRWAACATTLSALAITLTALLIYLLAPESASASGIAPMTVGRSLLFIALAVGVLFIHRESGIIGLMLERSAAGMIMRRLVLAALALVPMLGWGFTAAVYIAGVALPLAIAGTTVAGIAVAISLTVWSATSIRQLDQQRAAAEQRVQQLAEQRRRMLDVGQSLASALSAETVVTRLSDALPAVLRHTWFGLYELDEPAGLLRPISESSGYEYDTAVAGWAIPLDRSIAAEAVRERRALLVNHAERDPRSAYPPGWSTPIEHVIAVPLLHSERAFGAFVIARDETPPFSDAEFESVQFLAAYAALALSNARLFAQATRSEELAREREEMLRAIGDNLPTGVIYQLVRESPTSIHYTYISGASTKLGMAADELYSNPNRPKMLVHPDDLERYREANRIAFEMNQPIDIEVRRYRPDGQLVWHHIASQPRQLPSGQIVWDGITYDITARKQSEAELQAAYDALKQRNGELAALNRIAQALTQWIDLPTAMGTAAAAMREQFGGLTIMLWQIDEQRQTMRLLASAGEVGLAQGSVVPLTPGLDQIVEVGAVTLLPDCASLLPEGTPDSATPATSPLLMAPLMALGQPVGLMCIHAEQLGYVFTAEQLALAETVASSLANAIDNARLFTQAQASAAEEERRRIARDLHDSVSQALFAAARIAATLPQTWELDPEEGRDALGELQRLTGAALAEMRALLVELRPRDLVEAPLHEVLAHLVPLITSRSTAAIQTRLAAVPLLPADVQVALYRLTQEALNNVSKHAQARLVTVTLDASPPFTSGESWSGGITLHIRDDGRGFDMEQRRHGHLGLALMRERAAAIGAALTIASRAGSGTDVTIVWQSGASAAANASAIIGRDATAPLNGGRLWTADPANVTSRPR